MKDIEMTVRNNLVVGEYYNGIEYTREMDKYTGRTVQVIKDNSNIGGMGYILIKEDTLCNL